MNVYRKAALDVSKIRRFVSGVHDNLREKGHTRPDATGDKAKTKKPAVDRITIVKYHVSLQGSYSSVWSLVQSFVYSKVCAK